MRTLGHSSAEADLRSAVESSLGPPRAADRPPRWLLPEQQDSFARALWAVRRHGLSLIADAVGSGKTYVALAAASVLNPAGRTVCIVPAVLASQWAAVAARLRVPVSLHSHEKASRGRVPADASPLAIIDESHRFRMPSTKRYRVLASWLLGRRVVLLTGTPVVNRAADLFHQLRLGVSDDELAEFGVPSLAALLDEPRGHPALARVVIIGRGGSAPGGEGPSGRPRRQAAELKPNDHAAANLARRLDSLRLSTAPDVAALVRIGLLRAVASSPAAFAEALRNYRSLLRHAADAAAAGRPVTRRDLRAAVGSDDAQLVLWSLLESPEPTGAVELDERDLPLLDVLLAAAAGEPPDCKADLLRSLLSDGRRSIVFVTHRATVAHLRGRLQGLRVGWCTGSAAGVGRVRVPRAAVLAAFDPAFEPASNAAFDGSPDPACAADARSAADTAAATRQVPIIDALIATDVAAEGLDLQRAERIVHYDLPWTPMRIRQREGRALRLGSRHSVVEVLRFRPPPAVERRLGMTRVLQRKEQLPVRLGIARPAAGFADAPGYPARSREGGDLPTFAPELLIVAAAPRGPEGDSIALLRRADGSLVTDPGTIRRVLLRLGRLAPPSSRGAEDSTDIAIDSVRRIAHRGTDGAPPAPPRALSAELLARLTRIAADAAKARDDELLERVESALRFLRRPRTAGEDAIAAVLADCSLRELGSRIYHLPAERPAALPWEVRLVTVV